MLSARTPLWLLCLASVTSCTGVVTLSDLGMGDVGAGTDVAFDTPVGLPDTVRHDSGTPCTDMDHDGISDVIEGRYLTPPTDTDRDGTPDYLDTDSDNDGIDDIDEGIRNYAGFASEALPPLACGDAPNNCSPVSGLGNWRNLDSDADGVSDHDEVFTWHLDPCNPNTHNDPVTGMPVSDLVWAAGGGMAPPPSSFYMVLLFVDPACGSNPSHTHRQFSFATRFVSADVFFVIDTTAPMAATLSSFDTALHSTIIPGILSAIGPSADVRIGAADYRSYPELPDGTPGSDYILHVGQRLTHDDSLFETAVHGLQAGGGGDGPNPAPEAIYQSFVGSGLDPGIPGHDSDLTPAHGCILTAVGATCTAPDSGWASAMDPVRDCGDDPTAPTSVGWGCFQPGRVPIIVQISDADWVHDLFDDCNAGAPCSSAPFASTTYGAGGHTFAQLDRALTAGGAYFVGIDVGTGGTHVNATRLALDTGTLDGTGAPIAPTVSSAAISSAVVNSITTIANETRQDVTTRIVAVPDSRIAMGHTSADFIKAVTPVSATPAAPLGYDHADATTFYGVSPSATVTFDLDFYDDFQPPGMSLSLFQVLVLVTGRAGTVVDQHRFYVLVLNGCASGG